MCRIQEGFLQMHLITPGLPIIDAVIAHPGKALQVSNIVHHPERFAPSSPLGDPSRVGAL